MRRVYSTLDIVATGYLQQLLERAGIDSFIKNQYLSGAAGELPPHECHPELWIADDSRHDDALRLITAALAPPSADQKDWTCPVCGEHIERQFGLCWQCGASSPD